VIGSKLWLQSSLVYSWQSGVHSLVSVRSDGRKSGYRVERSRMLENSSDIYH
jgi:hypothetical protein